MKRPLLYSILTLALLISAGCGGGAAAPTVEPPTSTPPPSATPSPTPTLTPTATATLALPVGAGTLAPSPKQAISASNIADVEEQARWGTGRIFDAAYSPDGKLIAIATPIGITFLDSQTLEEKSSFETKAAVRAIAFSPDSATLLTGLEDNSVSTWNVADGKQIKSFTGEKKKLSGPDPIEEWIPTVAFSEDGSMVAAGSNYGIVNVWKTADGSVVKSFKNHTAYVARVFFAPDGESVYSASWDGTVRRSALADGKLIHAYGGQVVRDAKLSKDGKTLATFDLGWSYSGTGSLILWDVESGKKLQTIKAGDYYLYLTSLSFSPDGKYIASGWKNYTVQIWSTSSGALINTFEDLKPKTQDYYYAYPVVSYAPDGSQLMYAGRNTVATWEVQGASLLQNKAPFSEPVLAMALSPKGSLLASVDGMAVHLRNFPDGSPVESKDEMATAGYVAFSPDGSSIAVSWWDTTARIWPATAQGTKRSFAAEASKAYVTCVAFAPDGKTLALAIHPQVELRNIEDGSLTKKIATGLGSGLNDMQFSPDGTLLAIAGAGMTKLVRIEDAKTLKSSPAGNRVAFSPDGKLLAISDWGKTVQLWDTATREAVLTLTNNSDNITAMSFSPDGSLLAVGGADGKLALWKVDGGDLLRSWQAHAEEVSDLAFTSDGNMLVSSSWDGTIRVWGVTP